ncbi:hypothetical protein EVAR_7677_1 [Eumeta japonica]|uniref:Uncharacterized protein n=1 Tax=Eumeta variegata TaxID=151549 RepID=A0A4C1TJ79_EUMVA|nr:hypothetical protein EVAR_7677_1 [Eumeta japonica]
MFSPCTQRDGSPHDRGATTRKTNKKTARTPTPSMTIAGPADANGSPKADKGTAANPDVNSITPPPYDTRVVVIYSRLE